MKAFPAVLFLIISMCFLSCSTERPKGKTEAEVLYKEAQRLFKKERFLLATERLNLIKSQHPYSYYATEAELLLADISFKQESYVEASAAYLLFKDLHPRHKKVQYVVWKVAESFFNQIPPTFDRDLSPAHQAIKYYNELALKYPNSKYTKNGIEKIATCKEMIRKKEQYIADFYYKTDVFFSARHRYLDILKTFEDKKLRNHSMIRIVKSSFKLKEFDKCIEYSNLFKTMIDLKNKKKLAEIHKECENSKSKQ